MRMILKTCVLSLAMAFSVAACGQKGPLFLPGNPSEIRSIPPTEPAEQREDEEDEERVDEPR